MPVVVIGPTGDLGLAAVGRLVEQSPEVRAYVEGEELIKPLRARGAKVAVGELDDVDTLTAVMRGAHTVCHLAGRLELHADPEYEHTNLVSVQRALEAAEQSRIARFLFVGYVGASPEAANPFLRFTGLAEEAVAGSSIDHVILRCTHVYPGPIPVRKARASTIVIGSGRQRLAPLFAGDLAAVLAAADDRAETLTGRWGLEGPDAITADELAELLFGSRRPKRHLSGSRARRATGLSDTALEVLAADCLADAPDAAAAFGVERTPLRAGLERAWQPVLER